MLARRKWQRLCPRKRRQTLLINHRPQRTRNVTPRFFIWEKRLRRTEGAAVVIRVQKPRRHFIRLRRLNSIIDRIVGIHAFHFDEELPIVSPHHLRSRRADDSEELIAVRLPKQVPHRDIRRNFREMRLDAPMLSGNYRLCLRFKTETGEQQHLVLTTRRR